MKCALLYTVRVHETARYVGGGRGFCVDDIILDQWQTNCDEILPK